MAKRTRTPAWPDRVGAVAVLSSSALPLQRQPFEHKVRILQDAKGNKYFACAEADSVTILVENYAGYEDEAAAFAASLTDVLKCTVVAFPSSSASRDAFLRDWTPAKPRDLSRV